MAEVAAKQRKHKMSRLEKKNTLIAYSFLAPNFLGFAIFTLVPVVCAILLAFVEWNGGDISNAHFVGLQNFAEIFKADKVASKWANGDYLYFFNRVDLGIALKNTVFYALINVPLTLVCAIALALALNKAKPKAEQAGKLQIMFNGSAMQAFNVGNVRKSQLYTGRMMGNENCCFWGGDELAHYDHQALNIVGEANIRLSDFHHGEEAMMLVGVPEDHLCRFKEHDAAHWKSLIRSLISRSASSRCLSTVRTDTPSRRAISCRERFSCRLRAKIVRRCGGMAATVRAIVCRSCSASRPLSGLSASISLNSLFACASPPQGLMVSIRTSYSFICCSFPPGGGFSFSVPRNEKNLQIGGLHKFLLLFSTTEVECLHATRGCLPLIYEPNF